MSTQKITQILEAITHRWAAVDTKLLHCVFPLLAEGVPVPVARIAETAETDLTIVEAELIAAHSRTNGNGEVIEFFGLTLEPFRHQIEINGSKLFSCCALVAQMTPHFLSSHLKVESVDPVTKQIVKIEISTTGVKSLVPNEAVSTLVAIESLSDNLNIAAVFCGHVNHFVSRDSAELFVSDNPKRFVVSIEELFQAGKQLYSNIWR